MVVHDPTVSARVLQELKESKKGNGSQTQSSCSGLSTCRADQPSYQF